MGKFDPSGLRVSDLTLALYRAEAERNRRSLEDELSVVFEANRPKPVKDVKRLLALSHEMRALSGMTSDSTPDIRWARDTDDGRYLGGSASRDEDAGD